MRTCLPVLLLVLAAMGGGCRMPSERAVYKAARDAVKADPRLPPSAILHSIDDVEMGIGKNAARVDLAYDFIGPAGQRVTDSYVVWLKRLARTWVVDRLEPAPKYPPPPDESSLATNAATLAPMLDLIPFSNSSPATTGAAAQPTPARE